MISTSCSEYIFPVGRTSTKDWTQLLNATWAFQFMTKKKGGKNRGWKKRWFEGPLRWAEEWSAEWWEVSWDSWSLWHGQWSRIQLVEDCVHAKLLQSCPTLCNTMDCSPPGSSVRGILQARKLEWIAVSYSRGSSQPRDRTHVSYISCIGKQILYH